MWFKKRYCKVAEKLKSKVNPNPPPPPVYDPLWDAFRAAESLDWCCVALSGVPDEVRAVLLTVPGKGVVTMRINHCPVCGRKMA